MADALSVLDEVSGYVAGLARSVEACRTKLVPIAVVQPIARNIATAYFEVVRSEVDYIKSRAGLVEEIDFCVQSLLGLAEAPREKAAYVGQLNELRPYLLEATIDLMKARGAARLVLSRTERSIFETLSRMLPPTAASYEQALRDLAQGTRVSWRGTATELREALREVIDHLAPDDKVAASPGFQLEAGRPHPTQKQKVRFILRARKSSSSAVTVAEGTLVTLDEAIAALARSTYDRSSASTHSATNDTEIRNLKRYVDALLAELLEVR
jgi:hypothetical protein